MSVIAVSSIRTLAFRVLSVFAGLGLNIAMARMVGPDARGLYALATMVASIGTIIFANASTAVTFQVSRLGKEPATVLRHGLLLGLMYGVVVATFTFLWTVVFPDKLSWLWAVAVAVPMMLLTAFVNGAMLGTGRILQVNIMSIMPTVVSLLFVPTAIILGQQGVLVAWVTGQGSTMLWALWQSRKLLKLDAGLLPVDWSTIGELNKFGVAVAAANLLSFLNYRIDAFVVESTLGLKALGIYSTAVSIGEMLWFVSSSLSTAIYARVGQLDSEDAASLTAKAIRHTCLFVSCSAAFLFIVGAPLIPVIFGQEFAPAVVPFRILLPGVAAYSVASLISVYFTNQLGRPGISTWLAAASMLINLLISLLLIPRIGMSGGAIATSASYLIVIVFALGYFQRTTRLAWKSMLLLDASDWNAYRQVVRKAWRFISRGGGQSEVPR